MGKHAAAAISGVAGVVSVWVAVALTELSSFGFPGSTGRYGIWLILYLIAVQVPIIFVEYGRRVLIKLVLQVLALLLGTATHDQILRAESLRSDQAIVIGLSAVAIWWWIRAARTGRSHHG